MRTLIQFLALPLVAGGLAAACASNTTPLAVPRNPINAVARTGVSPNLTAPALITLDSATGDLEYWPIRQGGDQPKQLSASLGIFQPYGLAGNGNVVAIANYSPPEIVTYNVKTKATTSLPDPAGGPVDIAIGKDGTIYALNISNVAVYPPRSSQPSTLGCQYISDGLAVAVDNESDLFVNGYGPGGFMGVVEFPAGSKTCAKVPVRKEQGYLGGIGIDPKTDDLIVIDDPDLCAGGIEGEMLVYPKPYGHRIGHKKDLNVQYCAGTFRLNATSTMIFVSDATVSAGYPLIEQSSYPGGQFEGTYQAGPLPSGDAFGGFTTIPNTLPN
jgi:hypothetical protein